MTDRNNTYKAFITLLKAGLWEKNVRLSTFDRIDLDEIYRQAEEQSVVGIVAAGLEHVEDVQLPKDVVLTFAGCTLQIEQRSFAMNFLIKHLIEKMRREGIYTLLIKGQGVAQCYERPLWRSCGDVDLYLSESNYENAKKYLSHLASFVDEENEQRKHIAYNIDKWVVELHGTLHNSLSKRINKGLDQIHQDIFYAGEVRSWLNDGVSVFLPSANNDILIVFTHFVTHFYIGGIGLRQICDWCRLLWTYRDSVNLGLLEGRLKKMGLMPEWKAFASLAVEHLDMPQQAMPFYTKTRRNSRRARRVLRRILVTGNMGHNQDQSYKYKYSNSIGKVITFFRRLKEFWHLSGIFPMNAPRFFVSYVFNRIR